MNRFLDIPSEFQLKKIVVFSSGRGSNFSALLENIKLKKLTVEPVALVCNEPEAQVLELAEKNRVPTVVVSHKGLNREDHEQKILNLLKNDHGIDLLTEKNIWAVLAGYMRLFSGRFIQGILLPHSDIGRMTNIHPSLLPSFKGVHGYTQAFEYGVKVTGATVHLVNEALDAGPILAQKSFEIKAEDTLQEVEMRGLKIEHELYAQALEDLKNNKIKVRLL